MFGTKGPSPYTLETTPTGMRLLEEYALNPESRPDLVQNCYPGSKEYYLLHLRLLSQELQDPSTPVTSEKLEKVRQLLRRAETFEAFQTDKTVLEQFRSQLALLAYPVMPDLLLKQLDFDPDSLVQLNNSAASFEKGKQEPRDLCDELPTVLDENMINTEVLLDQLMAKLAENFNSSSVPSLAWPYLLANPKMEALLLKTLSLDDLLALFTKMDLSLSSKILGVIEGSKDDANRFQMDRMIVNVIMRLYQGQKQDFTQNPSKLRCLTSVQLDTIKAELPNVMANEGFVGLLEQRIMPRVFVEPSDQKSEAHAEWLSRMLAFVDTLLPKFNRYKLAVYLMSLEFDVTRGIMEKDKFMRYIDIPRNHHNYNSELLKKASSQQMNVVNIHNDAALAYWSNRVTPASKARDEETVKRYLSHFIQQEKSVADYEKYFELNSYLNPLLARVMLTSGDQDIAKWSEMLPEFESLSRLTEQTIIKFTHDNPETFLPSDPVVFKLKVKNAKRILVRVFEVKTLEYLQQHEGTVGQALSLDGLTPNWEHNFALDHPPLEIHELKIDLPELAGRRGAFVMDVICNGENSTAYFTKGYLDFVERQSVAGHVLTIIDENRQKISDDVSVWFNGFNYKTNGDGDIIIPYRNKNQSSEENIFITHKDFTSRLHFHHCHESYHMDLSCYLDHESLIAGSIAKVLIKPVIRITNANVVCPVDLLEQIVLEVTSYDMSDIETAISVPDFKLHDSDWSEYHFHVPENLAQLEFVLSAKIKVLTTGKLEDISSDKRFTVETNDADRKVTIQVKNRKQDVHIDGEILTVLRQTGSGSRGYEILVLGKNGERRPNIPLNFDFTHPMSQTPLDICLRSNSEGIIRLGDLQDITEVTCHTSCNTWELLPHNKYTYPDVIHGIAGETINVPFARRDELCLRSVSLFKRSSDRYYLEDATDKIELPEGLLAINGLTAGYYDLHIGDEVKIDLVISNRSNAMSSSQTTIKGLEEFNIESDPMLEIPDSTKRPLYMTVTLNEALTESSMVNIKMFNWTPATRVCITASRFLPHKSMFENMAVLEFEKPWQKKQVGRTSTAYRTGRILGQEYQYILNRRAQSKHWAGNLLTKPSALLTPWSVGETTMAKQEMADQNLSNVITISNQAGATPATHGRGLGKGGAKRHRRILPRGAPPPLSFLLHPSLILPNLIPDALTGEVKVPYSELKEGSFVQIFVTDGAQAIQSSFAIESLVKQDFQKRDLRFKSSLDHKKHYIGERTGISLDPTIGTPGAISVTEPHSITLASSGTSSSAVRVINSVTQVYDLMMTLLQESDKQSLRKFGFVVDWHKFSTAIKNEKFSKWNCHELNLFLYKKDRPYFDSVVMPFIKNKLVKSFVDDFLIEASLEKYTTLREFNLLTCMEKCLLAYRIPRLRQSVARWIRSRVRNAKVASDVKLFRTVMKSGATEEVGGASPTNSENGNSKNPLSGLEAKVDKGIDEFHWDDSSLEEEFEVVESTDFRANPNPAHAPQGTMASGPAQYVQHVGLFGSTAAPGSSNPGVGHNTAFGAASSSFGAAAPTSGATTSSFGAPAPVFGAASSLFGSSTSSFGAAPASGAAPAFGTASSPFGAATSSFGAAAPKFVTSTSSFGAPAPALGAASSSFGAATSSFGAPSTFGAFGAPSAFSTTNLGLTSLVAPASALPPPPPVRGSFGSGAPPPPPQNTISGFGSARSPAVHMNANYLAARQQTEQTLQQQFKPVDLTKEMAETYYWGRQDKAVETGKSDVNAFWMDFVEWDESKGGLFLSQNFVVNTNSFTSAMATIALLDVTFKPKEALIRRSVDRSLVVSSVSPAIVFHSSTKEVKETPLTGSVLVTQQYFVGMDRTEYNPKLVTHIRKYTPSHAVFSPLESYGAHVVLMNATPDPMKLHVEVQLPQGAISIYHPLESNQDVQLSAHRTFQYEYYFYFPEAGDFPHYPAHVSDYEDIIAFAGPAVLKVRKPEPGEIQNPVDTSSWNYTLSRGSQEDVLSKLTTDPLDGMRVELLIPRLYRDMEFFKQVTNILRDRHEYIDKVWSVSLVLGGEGGQQLKGREMDEQLQLVGEYVENQAIAQKVGYWFTSPLLKRRRRSRYEATAKAFHYLEYFPLINARVHKATKKATILNDRFKAQYERFLTLLSQKPSHDVDDLFVLIVYLIAQDRILEAKGRFVKLSAMVTNGHLENQDDHEGGACNFQQIQYDYLRAYLCLCVEVQVDDEYDGLSLDLEGIQEIVNKYQDYPVQRWRRLFQDMKTYVDEISGTNSSSTSATAEAIESLLKTEEDTVMVTSIPESVDDELTTSHANMPIKNKTRSKNIPVAVDFKIGSDSQITIHHRGIDEITVEYYVIDAETMFSASPLTFSDQGESEINVVANKENTGASSSRNGSSLFTQQSPSASSPSSTSRDSTSYRLVKPNGVDKHTVLCADSTTGVFRVPILDRYMNTNVMISVSTVPPAAIRTWKAYCSQTISVQCQELSGTIKVVTKPVSSDSDLDTNMTYQQPIRGGYVKVYAEMKNGSGDFENTVFWKDGYTDLVGRFNYATVSTGAGGPLSTLFGSGSGGRVNRGGLTDVKRFVVFVDGGKEGCVVKTAPVPPV